MFQSSPPAPRPTHLHNVGVRHCRQHCHLQVQGARGTPAQPSQSQQHQQLSNMMKHEHGPSCEASNCVCGPHSPPEHLSWLASHAAAHTSPAATQRATVQQPEPLGTVHRCGGAVQQLGIKGTPAAQPGQHNMGRSCITSTVSCSPPLSALCPAQGSRCSRPVLIFTTSP